MPVEEKYFLDFQRKARECFEQGRLCSKELGGRGEDRDGATLAFDHFNVDVCREHRLDHLLFVVTTERKHDHVIK